MKYFNLTCIAALLLGLIGLTCVPQSPSDKWLEHRVVKIVSEHGSCSGEQVRASSGVDYILTAAHCRVLESADGSFTVITEDGHTLVRRFIEEDTKSDLLLIEGLPHTQGLGVAGSEYAKEAVRTFTHGHGFDTYKTEGVLVQDYRVEVMLGIISSPAECPAMPKNKVVNVNVFGADFTLCVLSVDEVVTTAFISPGSSGGPVVDSQGKLVGVVSAGGEQYGFLVRLQDIQDFLAGY